MVDLANSFARDGHEVTVVAAFKVDERLLRNTIDDSIDVQYVIEKKVGRLRLQFEGLLWTIRKLGWLRSHDILHCHLSFASVFGSVVHLSSWLTKNKQPAVVETYHAVGMPFANWKKKIHKWLASRRDAIAMMAYDESWQPFVKRHPRILVEVIPNGVDTSCGKVSNVKRQVLRESIGVPDSCELIIGTMGQFRPERLPTMFVELMAMISHEVGPEVHFLLVGDGAEFDNVQDAIRNHGLEGRIHTPGVVNDPKLGVSIMDLYLTLNVGSVTGLAAIEAAFAGVPIVGYQLNDQYEITSSDWIWTSRDLEVIANRAIELVRSPKKRNELGESQMEYAKSQHSLSSMQSNYFNLYQRAIEAASTR
ncbi:2-deoxystreptamine glucosyltransferase [Planctomycetes bacterium K23_9]|uniref:2-deoxystreptamine glucosyltransferase n=2 Tax=Stieleria marina TaxID=1930275 RepID=A0A517NYT0_9BACT|nr:2-deoxystreptamine glucosyltransferase [Planctomycetes bacterium K23_9]